MGSKRSKLYQSLNIGQPPPSSRSSTSAAKGRSTSYFNSPRSSRASSVVSSAAEAASVANSITSSSTSKQSSSSSTAAIYFYKVTGPGLMLVELTVTCPYVHLRLYSLEMMSRTADSTTSPADEVSAEADFKAEMTSEALAAR